MERDSPTQGFLQGFERGRRAKQDKDRFAQEQEDRDLARKKLKLDMDRLKISDMEESRKAAFAESEHYSKLFEPPDTQGATGSPFTGGHTTTIPGQHPSIHVPEGGYGQPATDIQPTGMRAMMAAQEAQKRSERQRTVNPEQAATLGLPAGQYDEDIFKPVAEAAQGRQTRASIEGEGTKNRTSQERIANIYASANRGLSAGGAGASTEDLQNDQTVMGYVGKLNSGEATLSQVPSGKQGGFMRDKVVRVMTGMDLSIMTPKMQEKLSQFIPAQAAVEKLEGTLSDIQNAQGFVATSAATMQLNREVKAFSRLVGRAIGEKGVFTDADKDDFANLLQPWGGGVTTAITANVAPEYSAQVLKELKKLMDKVKQREFAGVRERAKGPFPPGAAGTSAPGVPKTAEEYLRSLGQQK